jgi:hypothetical protein
MYLDGGGRLLTPLGAESDASLSPLTTMGL